MPSKFTDIQAVIQAEVEKKKKVGAQRDIDASNDALYALISQCIQLAEKKETPCSNELQQLAEEMRSRPNKDYSKEIGAEHITAIIAAYEIPRFSWWPSFPYFKKRSITADQVIFAIASLHPQAVTHQKKIWGIGWLSWASKLPFTTVCQRINTTATDAQDHEILTATADKDNNKIAKLHEKINNLINTTSTIEDIITKHKKLKEGSTRWKAIQRLIKNKVRLAEALNFDPTKEAEAFNAAVTTHNNALLAFCEACREESWFHHSTLADELSAPEFYIEEFPNHRLTKNLKKIEDSGISQPRQQASPIKYISQHTFIMLQNHFKNGHGRLGSINTNQEHAHDIYTINTNDNPLLKYLFEDNNQNTLHFDACLLLALYLDRPEASLQDFATVEVGLQLLHQQFLCPTPKTLSKDPLINDALELIDTSKIDNQENTSNMLHSPIAPIIDEFRKLKTEVLQKTLTTRKEDTFIKCKVQLHTQKKEPNPYQTGEISFTSNELSELNLTTRLFFNIEIAGNAAHLTLSPHFKYNSDAITAFQTIEKCKRENKDVEPGISMFDQLAKRLLPQEEKPYAQEKPKQQRSISVPPGTIFGNTPNFFQPIANALGLDLTSEKLEKAYKSVRTESENRNNRSVSR